MSNRVDSIERILNVKLPPDYKKFIVDIGLISDERGEVFGYIEGIDSNKIPCVIGATHVYKKNYANIFNDDLVISFDELKNTLVVLNTESGFIYGVDFKEKIKISDSFTEWLNEKGGFQ